PSWMSSAYQRMAASGGSELMAHVGNELVLVLACDLKIFNRFWQAPAFALGLLRTGGSIATLRVLISCGQHIGNVNGSLVEDGAADEKARPQGKRTRCGDRPWWATMARKSLSTLWIAAS